MVYKTILPETISSLIVTLYAPLCILFNFFKIQVYRIMYFDSPFNLFKRLFRKIFGIKNVMEIICWKDI